LYPDWACLLAWLQLAFLTFLAFGILL
jgi:hypothetical protein